MTRLTAHQWRLLIRYRRYGLSAARIAYYLGIPVRYVRWAFAELDAAEADETERRVRAERVAMARDVYVNVVTYNDARTFTNAMAVVYYDRMRRNLRLGA
jgi:hypothetical protein